MKINFAAEIRNLEGETMRETAPLGPDGRPDPEKSGKPVTLGSISCTALLATYEDERNLAGEEKVKRFRLASKATDGGEQELSVEEAALLKKLIGKAFGPLVVGRAYDIIDPPKVESAEKTAS